MRKSVRQVLMVLLAAGPLMLLSGCMPPSPQELIDRGIVQFRAQQLDRSETNFKRALDVSPANPTAMFYLGRINHERGFLEMAIYYYQAALAADPSYPGAALYLSGAQKDAGPVGQKLRFLPKIEEE